MRVNKIKEILDNFIYNNQKSILIDGEWGVGKTFQVNRFMKEHPNSKYLKIIYVSLFGKESKDEIHTELYAKLHPRINLLSKTSGLISTAISLVPQAPDISKTLDFILEIIDNKTDEVKYENRAIKRKNIIIFDDLERKGKKLDFTILLGYLNQLLLSNFKIAVICSEQEISKDKNQMKLFSNFKEKIFDRYYSITMADVEVIKSYFQEDSRFLDNEIIKLFENNLRLASKTSKFYFESKVKLKEKNIEFSIGTLLWYSVLVVIEFNKITLGSEVPLEERASPIEFYNQSERIRAKLLTIKEYDNKVIHPFKYNAKSYNTVSNHDIIEAVYYAYFYDDYEKLYNSFTPKDVKTIPVLKQNIFLLDSAGKTELINKKIKYIYENQSIKFDTDLLSILSDLFQYENYFPQDFDMEKFSDFLAEKYLGASNDLNDALQFFGPTKFQEFIQNTLKKNDILSENKLLNDLKESFDSKDLNKVQSAIQNIRSSAYIKDNDQKINKKFQDFVIENNFFLLNLSGTITKQIWDLSYESCGLAVYLGVSSEMQDYLKSILNKKIDVEERERIEALLEYGFKNGRWN